MLEGNALRRESRRFGITALLIGILNLPLASGGSAELGAGLAAGKNDFANMSIVKKAHGFHCRPVRGWDPRLGIYHLHSHEAICRNHQRCMKVMYRCNFVMGRGWNTWDFERWGSDNWRFDKCMLDSGCY